MIIGLVIHLRTQQPMLAETLRQVSGHPAFEIAARNADRLPLILEAEDAGQAHELTDWLRSLPGVVHVDITFADVEGAGEHQLRKEQNA